MSRKDSAAHYQSSEAMLMVTRGGRILACTGSALLWLSDFFGTRSGAHQLPEQLRSWLAAPVKRGCCRPLTEENSRAQLVVKPLCREIEGALVLLLQLRRCGAAQERLRRLGLTERQTEILHLLESGKSNKEIAAEIGITPSTVRTHLEQLYRKLGVNNRTAAAGMLGIFN